MKRLALLMLAMLTSVVLYVAVFSVVHRPLTVGDIPPIVRSKFAYARSLPSPKLVVFAGSNGVFSHRCETLTAATGWPCANVSLAVGIALDFQFPMLLEVLRPGDVVYMPLEYLQYRVDRNWMHAGVEETLLAQYFRDRLWRLDPGRIVRAYASFDLPFLVHGLGETALAARHYVRRLGAQTLSPQGDERGHTAAVGDPFRDFLRAERYTEPALEPGTYAQQVVGRFLDDARANGVTVVGGLPTVPDDAQIPAGTLTQLRHLYQQHGQAFLVLPNESRYPRHCFFDTLSHLNEECQIRHSQAVGEALRRWTTRSGPR